jgi:hypothetical protein
LDTIGAKVCYLRRSGSVIFNTNQQQYGKNCLNSFQKGANMCSKWQWRAIIMTCLVILLAANVMPQTGTSSVSGRVVDAQGSVIPGAIVILTNVENKQARRQLSSASGSFDFEMISPGDYQLQVEAAHFKKLNLTVHATVGRPSEITLKLEVGGTSEVITVVAEASNVAVNTVDAALGSDFVSKQITQLPLEARNVVALLSLQPGVTSAPDFEGYVAGARSDQSNVTLDGVNINDAQSNSVTGPVLRLNSEAIEEFRVSTTTASAAAGRSAGAQIELVTKSGTNTFRGAFFDYHRQRLFNANDWFNNYEGIERPQLIRNNFGATFGGPIKKDKVFFFYSYEGRRDAKQQAGSPQYVPTASLGQGLVKFPNSGGGITTLTPADIAAIFPDTGGENPVAVKALAAAAAKYTPNDFTIGDSTVNQLLNVAGFRYNANMPVSWNSHVAKFDFSLTPNQTAFVRFNSINDHQAAASALFPDTSQPQLWNHPWGVAASHTWTIHNALVNSFRYGLTRQAFSNTGDLSGNDVYFRLVFYPVNGSRTTSRISPVHNFVDDLSWVHGKHMFQFGGSFTMVDNQRVSYATAWDDGTTNPSGYLPGMIFGAVNAYLTEKSGVQIASGYTSPVENTITALLGRLNQYTANVNYQVDGKLMQSGLPTTRQFATWGWEFYGQDTWKLRRNLTLTAGLRYGLWKPVWEKQGYEVQPTIPLGQYWDNRVKGMLSGVPYTELITLNKSGPVNNGAPMYNWDKTVFLPRAALAWSPAFDKGFLKKILGGPGRSVLRGGFAVANDYIGQSIAAFFDARNTLGFSSATAVPVNTYNVGCGKYVQATGVPACNPNSSSYQGAVLGPLFTSYGMDIRSLPNIPPVGDLTFPASKSAQHYPTRIESSIDSQLQTPREYVFSVTFERQLPHGGVFQASYLGRMGRHLLAERDIATPANLVDSKSGMDWYTAATILEKARQKGTPYQQIPSIPYFENLFPSLASAWGYPNSTQAIYDGEANYWGNDWTDTQLDLDTLSAVGTKVGNYTHAFYQPQYGALDVWSTVANSNYHAMALSYRQRLHNLSLDFNYTFSHSLDDASGLQSEAAWSSAALILNPLRQRDNYASSDFDMRHMINVNSVWQLPLGRGKTFLSGSKGALEAIFGGWQLSSIFRWNTGYPYVTPYDDARWATNFEVQSGMTPIIPIPLNGCPSKSPVPNYFGSCDNLTLTQVYQGFRNAYPGETGPRNIFRMPGYVNLDMGLGKTWKMPYKEGHELQFRWEVFNVTNTQQFNNVNTGRDGWGIVLDPQLNNAAPPPTWGNFTSVQGRNGEAFRIMQFGLRYSF